MAKTNDYQGASLIDSEYQVMIALEEEVGKPIPLIDRIYFDRFGFVANNGYITNIGLSRQDIHALPGFLSNLKQLKEICINHTPLNYLPDSLSKITTLEVLFLGQN